MTYYDIISRYNWDEIQHKIYASTHADMEKALAERGNVSAESFMALVSPAAEAYLEDMAEKSAAITRRRFGRTMQLYIPLYLSNICQNRCVYCGFNCNNKIRRAILSQEQIEQECLAVQRDPFQHILLVTGEAPRLAGVKYLGESIETAKKYFEQISIEVQPMETDDYRFLMDRGLHSVYVYQETYHEKQYPKYHPGGPKSDYRYRLETPDRLGKAGVYKIGLGNLIGLEDWRTDAFFTALHLRYLENTYWRTKYSVAFPRLRPHAGEGFQPDYPANERHLLQLICAYRLFSEDVELSLSTRESAFFRDHVMALGVTAMSAGSKTAPGGYEKENTGELEQFSVNDDRMPEQVKAAVQRQGLEPVWKDWSLFLQGEKAAGL